MMTSVSRDQNCPGSEAAPFPGSRACRLLALGDGSVVQQDVTPEDLCTEQHAASLRRMVARRFGDGQGNK